MIYFKLFYSFLLIGFTSFGGLSMVSLINEQMLVNGWMTASEVSDIVAISEMTPGPFGLNCATFAGARTAGAFGAFCASAGVLLPSFSLCLLATMFLMRLRDNKLLKNALYGIRASCIGLIVSVVIDQAAANYSGTGPLGLSLISVFIGAIALFVLGRLKWSIPKTVLLSAGLGLIFGYFTGWV